MGVSRLRRIGPDAGSVVPDAGIGASWIEDTKRAARSSVE